MARARNIKPSVFTNELLGTLPPEVTLLFMGLWCLADKDGILEDRPLRIKAEIFPYRDNLDVNGYLTVMEKNGFIQRYSVEGKNYIFVIQFAKHQSPHHTEKAKGYPKPPELRMVVTSPLTYGESLVPSRSDSLIPDSLIPDSKPLSKEKPLDDFETFWKAYPKRQAKKDAIDAWNSPKVKIDLPAILKAIEATKASGVWDVFDYIPLPASWLRGARWNDEILPPSTKTKLSTVVPTQARTCIHCKEPAHMEISGRWYCRNHDQYSTSEAA